jgi:hypothetical protein
MTTPHGNVFHASFLDRLQAEAGESDHAAEADLAGPWLVQQVGAQWHVVAEGEDVPEVVAESYETAMLAAALLPSVGRSRLALVSERDAEGYRLLGAGGEVLAHLRHDFQDLGHAMHVVECLRRSPLELARFLYSTRGSSLERAGRLLWTWEQAPPRQG